MRLSKLRRISLIFLIGVLGILLVLFVGLNLPFSQRFATGQVNRTLNRVHVPIQIDAIRKLLPGSVIIRGVTIRDTRGDTLIYAGEIEAGIRLIALLRSKVNIRDLQLDGVLVDIGRASGDPDLNIAAAFQAEKKKPVDPSDKEPARWRISLRRGELTHISFRMSDPVTGIQISQDITESEIRGFRIVLSEKELFCRSLDLNGAEGSLHLTPPPEDISNSTGPPWKILKA